MRALETWSSASVAYTLGVPPISPWSPSEVAWRFSGQFLYTPSLPASGTYLCDPKDYSPPVSFCLWKRILEYIAQCLLLLQGNLPDLGIEPTRLLPEPPGKWWRTTSASWLFRGTVVRCVLQTLKGSLEGLSISLPVGWHIPYGISFFPAHFLHLFPRLASQIDYLL